MPERPDLTVYREALAQRIMGRRHGKVRILSPFLLRTLEPLTEAGSKRRASLHAVGGGRRCASRIRAGSRS